LTPLEYSSWYIETNWAVQGRQGDDNMSHKREIAIVTGGTRGIGRGVAMALAAEGYTVVVNYNTSRQEAEGVVTEITAAGGEATCYQADVTSREAVTVMTQDVIEQFGHIDVLINNAGLNIDGPFLDMSVEDWSTVLQVNLNGTFNCTQIVAKSMMNLGVAGSIVNLSASTAISGRKNGANYCASKAGVIALTKCTALELAPHIRVNCILPGFIETQEVVDRFQLENEANRERVLASIPIRRIGQPNDVANMVSFLCSDKATYITGQLFFINGGDYTG